MVVDFYDQQATVFFERTVEVDMAPVYQRFLPLLKQGAHILDAGCGSGRDSKAFHDLGFQVSAMDASPELARLAEDHTGLPVRVCRFQVLDDVDAFDAIWACASLLHVPEAELPLVFSNLWRGLKLGGVFYCSFKYGDGERAKDGRHFTDANETRLRSWVEVLPGAEVLEMWQSEDQRPGSEFGWVNGIVRKG